MASGLLLGYFLSVHEAGEAMNFDQTGQIAQNNENEDILNTKRMAVVAARAAARIRTGAEGDMYQYEIQNISI